MATIEELLALAFASPEFKRALQPRKVLECIARHRGDTPADKDARKKELTRINGDDEATVPTLVRRTQERLERVFASAAARELDQALEIIRSTPEERRPGTLSSDAYATGQALYALSVAGGVLGSRPAYRRGAQFLLRTQGADGSWLVQSRTLRFQPHFEAGFPHGRNQFISAAATSWAVMALMLASEGAAGSGME